jgi:arylsulfatase A-like enzyme
MAIALVAAACRSAPPPVDPPAKGPPSPIEYAIERRLAPEDFSIPEPRLRPPVVEIGGEAREVVVGPRWIDVAELRGVRLDAGRAEVAITLPEETRGLPDEAFALSVQEIPAELRGLDPVALGNFAREGLFKDVARGWRLRREPGSGGAVVELDGALARAGATGVAGGATEGTGFNLRLTAQRPTPTRLESKPFPVSPGGLVELGFGRRAGATAEDGGGPRRYSARLACTGGAGSETAARLDDSGWRDVSIPVPAGSETCTLALAVDGTGARAIGAYFGLPRVLAPVPAGERADPPSLVLVSLDTLGAGHLSGYGYGRETSPTIDARLMEAGTSFMDVSTTFPRTDIAHVSLFTSLYPNAQPTAGRLLAEQPVGVLAEALGDAGFETAAFTEDAFLAGAFGFWTGFDRFREYPFDSAARGYAVFADAGAYLEEKRDRRFFLLVHTYRVHEPYAPSPSYRDLFGGWWESDPDPSVPREHRAERDAYDASIREADALVGTLLDRIDRLGLADRTIVVLLSDHGEAFGQHGLMRHGLGFHQEQLHVPLVFRGPGIPAGLRVTAPASLVDVAPTLLDLVALPPLPEAQGESLAAAFRGEPLRPDRPLYFSWTRKDEAHGLRQAGAKFIQGGKKHELFRLDEDPGERSAERSEERIGPRHGEELERLLRQGDDRRARLGAPGAEEGATGISEETERSLRALGYLD